MYAVWVRKKSSGGKGCERNEYERSKEPGKEMFSRKKRTLGEKENSERKGAEAKTNLEKESREEMNLGYESWGEK